MRTFNFLFSGVLFTFYDKLYVWWMPVLQFVIAFARNVEVEEDPLRLNSKKKKKRMRRFGVITFPYCEMRNELSHFQPKSGCALIVCCGCFLLFFFCVRTRLFVLYRIYFARVKLSNSYTKLNSKMNKKEYWWGDLLNVCAVLKFRELVVWLMHAKSPT